MLLDHLFAATNDKYSQVDAAKFSFYDVLSQTQHFEAKTVTVLENTATLGFNPQHDTTPEPLFVPTTQRVRPSVDIFRPYAEGSTSVRAGGPGESYHVEMHEEDELHNQGVSPA